MMSRPLSDAARAELAALQSKEWELNYRLTLPKAVWEAAHVEGIVGAGGLVEAASQPHLDGNLLRFTSSGGRLREVPIEALRSLQVDVQHGRGALEGAGLGLLAGAGLGALAGFAMGNDRPSAPNSDCGPCSFTSGAKATFGAIAGGVLGLGVGFLVGALAGHRDVIEFTEPGR